ncbi:MAG: hypothetical protein KDD33_04645 [Bdellovibrionales bacterium]|nr:hypothetical protein [Bdellovibrionales bacterium]
MKKFFACFILLSFTTGCALAPMTTTKNGRTVGKGKWEIDGNVLPAVGLSVSRGLTDNFDAGILIERNFGMVYSAWGKYSFINQAQGWSLAAYGGAFYGSGFGNSDGFFLGPVTSYRKNWFEVYLSARYSYVTWRAGSLTTDEQDDSIFDFVSWNDITFNYVQADLGFNFWTSDTFAINVHGKSMISMDKDVTFTTSVIPGFALIGVL